MDLEIIAYSSFKLLPDNIPDSVLCQHVLQTSYEMRHLKDQLQGALAFLRSSGPTQTTSIRKHIKLATESVDTTEQANKTLKRKLDARDEVGKMQSLVSSYKPLMMSYWTKVQYCLRMERRLTINVQLISEQSGYMSDVVMRWCGSTHDSTVFDNSHIRVVLETNQLEGYLIGNSGYPCLPRCVRQQLQHRECTMQHTAPHSTATLEEVHPKQTLVIFCELVISHHGGSRTKLDSAGEE